MIKVIILDVDGTLTNSKKDITPKTKQVLLDAQNQGIRLVLASGRTANGLKRYAKELEMDKHHGLLVSSNGAEVVDFETGEILFQKVMSIDEGKAVLKHIQQFDIVPMIAKGEYMYTNNVFHNTIQWLGKPWNIMEYEARSNQYLLCEVKDLVSWCDFEITKILTFGQPEYLQEHYKEIGEPFDHLNHMFTAPYYYEFTAQGVDKTKAIQESLIKLGYTEQEMIAFGDAQNDQSMLMFAGIGVAMANAIDSLKEVADEVTLSNEEDGIAYTLQKYLKKGETL